MRTYLSYKNQLLLLVVVIATACTKSYPIKYSEKPMVYIYKDPSNNSRDSATFSFIVKSETLTEGVVTVPLRIMGNASDRDRTVNLAVIADSTTAQQGLHFEMPKAIIPAGQFSAMVPVKVMRTADLKKNEVRLMLMIKESEDFSPGIYNTKVLSSGGNSWGTGLDYLIKINDFYSKPSNWDSNLKGYFGASFSQVKFKFLIEATGKTEFPTGPEGLPIGEFLYLSSLVKSKLAKYNTENGKPLLDENDQPVSFTE